ncbi:MAG: hypothetical protein M9948_08230, partial [Lentimicrobium sp.]|nr:hypothetical protein [Lentimicrobium sp.]
MFKKPTYLRWLLGLILMLFIWSNSYNLYAQSMVDRAKQAEIEAMHGPTVEVPYSEGTRAVGDNCTTPIVVNIPGDLPYADLGNTTCGRGNTYSNSDLGAYDGGEDIIYQLNVSATTEVTITLNTSTSTDSGLGLFTSCPTGALGAGNFWIATGLGGSTRTITRTLNPGTYYVMADTWPSPTCIPVLDLTITMPPPPPANDLCADAQAITCGDVITGSTAAASNTGAPTGCSITLNTAPGVWYSFTGNGFPATLSLAGSAFDTRLGVFSGTCGSLTCIYSDDDGGP